MEVSNMFESSYECYNMSNSRRSDLIKYAGAAGKKEKKGGGKLRLLLSAIIHK